jgi:hypothetical protein
MGMSDIQLILNLVLVILWILLELLRKHKLKQQRQEILISITN